MNKIYSRIDWKNEPNTSTPLNEVNLNKMDSALNEIDNRIIEQDTTKANKTELSNLISDWKVDEKTGVITITKVDGSQVIFDLNIEKIPVAFKLSDDGILKMTTDDGTVFSANIGAMIPVLTFEDTDTIAVSVSGSGVNKTYSFSVKDGSITESKLQPNYLAEIKVESASASQSASNALTSENNAKTSEENAKISEENANTSAEEAKEALEQMQDAQVTGVKGNSETSYRKGEVNITPANIGLGNVPNVATNNQTPTFTVASTRANIVSGEELSVIMGKIMKFFTDLKTVAFTGSYSNLSNKPTIPSIANNLTTTTSGKALDATQGKALNDRLTTLESGGKIVALGSASCSGTTTATTTLDFNESDYDLLLLELSVMGNVYGSAICTTNMQSITAASVDDDTPMEAKYTAGDNTLTITLPSSAYYRTASLYGIKL